jgi:hypothetical protein
MVRKSYNKTRSYNTEIIYNINQHLTKYFAHFFFRAKFIAQTIFLGGEFRDVATWCRNPIIMNWMKSTKF